MIIDAIPIWALFIATLIVVLLSIEAGYGLGRSAHSRSQDEKESPVSAIAGSILGLAAFMLSFAFGTVWERRDTRRELVRDDATAIRTAWQRSDFLPEADRAEAKDLLRQYVDLRLAFIQKDSFKPEHAMSELSEMRRIQDRLWTMAVANARKDMNSDVAAMYIDSLNEVNAIHAMRLGAGLQTRVPNEIWLVLYSITIIGMVAVGYQTGIAGSKRSSARYLLALSFAPAFVLIAALDRPDSGVMKVPQQPLIDLRDSMPMAARMTNAL